MDPATLRRAVALFLLAFPALLPGRDAAALELQAEAGGGLVQRYYTLAQALEEAGQDEAAREHYRKVLEREQRHLPTLHALARLERRAGDLDAAVDYAGRFLDTWRHLRQPPRELFPARRGLVAFLAEADPLRKRLDAQRRAYVGKLLRLADQQMDRGAWHSARAMLVEAIATDPEHPELAAGLERIRLEGGNELAVEDETGGADPLAGVTPEWVAENDAQHADWEAAWTTESEHYRIRTNAGYRMLMTVANAMEQMHEFYRIFHQYKLDGGAVPVAGVHIFKDGDEYKTLGRAPTDWAGGHWDGSKVVTYDQRGGGAGSLRGTLQVLFHEASHQFTSLAGGSAVPAWLNEGMASFFEGTRLLSNGKVDWNLVATGRLYPLVTELRSGKRHHLEQVIRGEVDDYRVYYPWGWGIVYYLYNAEDELGRLLYRGLLSEYFQAYHSPNHVERFSEFFVTRAAVAGVESLDEFERRFIEFVYRLEAEDKGKLDAARAHEERADLQVALEDWERAVELYDRSLQRDPDHPEVLWKLAHALERAGDGDRAAGVLRQWMAVAELDGGAAEAARERRDAAERRIERLDPVARRLRAARREFHQDSVALAAEYRELGFPRTALRVLQGPATAQPPSVAARELYFAIQDEFGVALEAWRLLFDEESLAGFYGAGAGNFQVENGVILARVEADPDALPRGRRAPVTGLGGEKGTTFAFRRLFIDREPAGDWSLAAEVALGEGCRMAGLCFGKKADGLFHGVALLPEGYTDLSVIETDATPLVRLKTPVSEGWNRLQLDVAGTRIVVRVNGEITLEYEFDSRAELQGDFGLLAGAGRSSFRDVRLLEYDRSMPRRVRIGRRRAGARLTAEGRFTAPDRARAGGTSFQGSAPPLLRGLTWVGAAPAEGDLDRLLGWPVVLVFTKSAVERDPAFSVSPVLERLEKEYGELEIPVLIVSNERHEAVAAWVARDGVRWPVASNWEQEVYEDYALKKHGIPRTLLLDLDGTVVWEGNPDYDPEYGSYLDEPLDRLVASRKLREVVAAGERLREAEALFQRGAFAAAAERWSEIVALDVPHPVVVAARNGMERLERRATERVERARGLAAAGRLLQAMALLERTASGFPGTVAGSQAAQRAAELASDKDYRRALRAGNRIARAEAQLVAGRLDRVAKELATLYEKAAADDDPWPAERARWLEGALGTGRPADEILADYLTAFPELPDPREPTNAPERPR